MDDGVPRRLERGTVCTGLPGFYFVRRVRRQTQLPYHKPKQLRNMFIKVKFGGLIVADLS